MHFCQGLYELMDSYDGFITDQWGVLHNGIQPYDGVIDALNHLKQKKKQLIILSNSAKRADDNVERLKKLGIKPSLYKAVVTAGEVTWQGLKEQKEAPFSGLGKKCYLIARKDDRSILGGLDIEVVSDIDEADFMLITSFDSRTMTLEDLEPVFRKAVAKKLHALCANPDMISVYGNERSAGPGAVAKKYIDLGGMAHLVGKPHKTIFRYCLSLFDDIIPSRVVMVGDSLQHDIAGGAGVDIDTAFVMSGIHAGSFRSGMDDEQKRKAMEHIAHGYGPARPNWVLENFIWQTPEAALRERERARMKE